MTSIAINTNGLTQEDKSKVEEFTLLTHLLEEDMISDESEARLAELSGWFEDNRHRLDWFLES